MRVIVILLFFISSCNARNPYISTLELERTEILLKENLKPVDPPNSIAALADDTFIIITKAGEVVHYNWKGDQINFITNFGQAENEIYSPSIVKATGNGYLVWDKDILKMVEYNLDDEAVKEYKGFDHAIRDFYVDDENIYTYINPLPGDPFIQIYNKSSRKIDKQLGSAVNEQILANLNVCSGGITTLNNSLIYVSSTSLNIVKVNPSDISDIQVRLINDESIPFKKFENDPVELINSDVSKAIQFSLSSSLVTGVHKMNDYLIIKGETGDVEVGEGSIDVSNRYDFIILLNKELDLIGKYYSKSDPNNSCKLWSEGPEGVVRILRKEGEEEFNYYIEKISFN